MLHIFNATNSTITKLVVGDKLKPLFSSTQPIKPNEELRQPVEGVPVEALSSFTLSCSFESADTTHIVIFEISQTAQGLISQHKDNQYQVFGTLTGNLVQVTIYEGTRSSENKRLPRSVAQYKSTKDEVEEKIREHEYAEASTLLDMVIESMYSEDDDQWIDDKKKIIYSNLLEQTLKDTQTWKGKLQKSLHQCNQATVFVHSLDELNYDLGINSLVLSTLISGLTREITGDYRDHSNRLEDAQKQYTEARKYYRNGRDKSTEYQNNFQWCIDRIDNKLKDIKKKAQA